jgi:hypothetical protein
MPRRSLPPPFPHQANDIPKLGGAKNLKIDVLSIPAFGHFQTTAGVAAALEARGHNVTFVLCDRSMSDFNHFNFGRAVNFRSAGPCLKYEERGKILAELIADDSSASSLGNMLNAVSDLSLEMCNTLMPKYEELELKGELPDLILFDADSYCAMDLSIRFRIPRVARVGTGLRDAYTNPIYAPLYSSGDHVSRLKAPFLERFSSRLKNAALIALSRYLIAPILLPNVYARHRQHWIENHGALDGKNTIQRERQLTSINGSSVYFYQIDEAKFRANLPFDGVPTLYNSHWGLEHPRPIQPYEHLIGHTNEFLRDSQEMLSQSVENWMSADENVPVVYVGLGTLSVLPKELVNVLSTAFSKSNNARFIWAGIQDTSLFPDSLVYASNRAYCACQGGLGNGDESFCSDFINQGNISCKASAHPGSLMLTGWAPQVPLLLHNSTRLFLTHGGMNGIAEGLYARLPLLCLPLFSDQPDNCAHAQDKGFALTIQHWRSETPESIQAKITRLLSDNTSESFKAASQASWIANIGAGGMHRAVELIEQTAALPYGSHLHMVPRLHFLPWYEALDLDVWGAALFIMFIMLLMCIRICRSVAACFSRKVESKDIKVD